MKKHKVKISPSLIPRRKKDMERLAANPEAVKAIIEMNRAAVAVLEKKETLPALTIEEWFERSFSILPNDYNTDEIKEKIKTCFIKEDLNDTHNER